MSYELQTADGRLYSVDWTRDWTRDWTVGLDSQKVALVISEAKTREIAERHYTAATIDNIYLTKYVRFSNTALTV